MAVTCDACKNNFSTQFALNRHMLKVHNTLGIDVKPSDVEKPSVMCGTCKKRFSSQSALNRHIREIHNTTKKTRNNSKYACQELNCDISYRENKDLIFHLQQEHNQIFEMEQKTFANVVEFKSWKHEIEQELNCLYIVATQNKGKFTYYNCNRTKTGKKSKWTGKRRFKSKGSCKLNFGCTSQMKVMYDKGDNNEVTVLWHKTHYGHEMEIEHLRLSTQDREDIAKKLINGIPKREILDQSREEIIKGKMKRKFLITNKDLLNIVHSYKLDIQHRNDEISIDLWVQEEMKSKENCILFYKKQGVVSDSLESSDFCLIVMNKFQETMLKKFGSNIITVDGTHVLNNNYTFELTIVIVVDEFGEGFPVTFMFSNRKDTYIYKVLFECMKSRVGTITTKTFMSDMDETFYKAWCQIMNPVTFRLFCSWHVDRAWQSNLSKIDSKEKRDDVYKMIKTLHQESDTNQFHVNFSIVLEFMTNNDEDIKSFAEYFKTNFSKNYKQWAHCYRQNTGININMKLESMHKTIKYFFLDSKKPKRLDQGLHTVLKFMKNKSVKRLLKTKKGKKNTFKHPQSNQTDVSDTRYCFSSSDEDNEIQNLVSLTNCVNENNCAKEKLRESMKEVCEIIEKNIEYLDYEAICMLTKQFEQITSLAKASCLKNARDKTNIQCFRSRK